MSEDSNITNALLIAGAAQISLSLFSGVDIMHSMGVTRIISLDRRSDLMVLVIEAGCYLFDILVLRKNSDIPPEVLLLVSLLTLASIWEMYFCHANKTQISSTKQLTLAGASCIGHSFIAFNLIGAIIQKGEDQVIPVVVGGLVGYVVLNWVCPLDKSKLTEGKNFVIPPETKKTKSAPIKPVAQPTSATKASPAVPVPVSANPTPEKKTETPSIIPERPTTPPKEVPEPASSPSALRENIDKKGENSYYFAHANTPTRENLNRGGDPVMLSKSRAESAENRVDAPKYQQIRKYAFSPGKAIVSIYIDLVDLLGKGGEDVEYTIDSDENSFHFVLKEIYVLTVPKLKHSISSASVKLNSSKERLTIVLKKANPTDPWASLS